MLQRLYTEEQERRLRYHAASTLMAVGTRTDNATHAERCFEQARLLLERLFDEFEENLTEEQIATLENPYSSLLSQARYRLAQIALMRGDTEEAANAFLQVILCDPDMVPRSMLALTWYDMGLIWMSYGSDTTAHKAFREAVTILERLQVPLSQEDEFLFSLCQKGIACLEEIRNQNAPPESFPRMPHSIDFAGVRYRHGVWTPYGVYEEVSKLFNPVLRASGAA